MDKGVIRQIENFRRDYRDGEAIAQQYLRLINSPPYLVASQKPEKKSKKEGRRKYEAAFKIFPGCRGMTKRCISNKMSRLGYFWDEKLKQWLPK